MNYQMHVIKYKDRMNFKIHTRKMVLFLLIEILTFCLSINSFFIKKYIKTCKKLYEAIINNIKSLILFLKTKVM